MEICRDGKNIELTEQELFLAYQEQEHIYDMENVKGNLETYLASGDYHKLREEKFFIEEAAYLLRRYLDKNNMSYEFAIEEAIKDAVGLINFEGV